jgi:hypothetical protein
MTWRCERCDRILLFEKVVFSSFLCQNNRLVLVGFYQTFYHHAPCKVLDILSGFSYEKSAGRRYRQCFLSEKSCRKMYKIFSAVLRQQRKSDVMTSFGHSAHSAIYYKADSPLHVCCHIFLCPNNDKNCLHMGSKIVSMEVSYF